MKTILLVDDEPHLRMLVHATLKDPQYRILEAPDGSTALAIARAEIPDLVVLDWMMPGMTGIEVARRLREDPATAAIPVMMLTAKGQAADRQRGEAAQVMAYLVKPFSPLELLAKVRSVIGGG